MKITRHKDGSVTLTSSNGTATISRTPPGVKEPPLREWTLEINGKVHDTYDTPEEAINAAKEILALKPGPKKARPGQPKKADAKKSRSGQPKKKRQQDSH